MYEGLWQRHTWLKEAEAAILSSIWRLMRMEKFQ
jgi:hypothetical protein